MMAKGIEVNPHQALAPLAGLNIPQSCSRSFSGHVCSLEQYATISGTSCLVPSPLLVWGGGGRVWPGIHSVHLDFVKKDLGPPRSTGILGSQRQSPRFPQAGLRGVGAGRGAGRSSSALPGAGLGD